MSTERQVHSIEDKTELLPSPELRESHIPFVAIRLKTPDEFTRDRSNMHVKHGRLSLTQVLLEPEKDFMVLSAPKFDSYTIPQIDTSMPPDNQDKSALDYMNQNGIYGVRRDSIQYDNGMYVVVPDSPYEGTVSKNFVDAGTAWYMFKHPGTISDSCVVNPKLCSSKACSQVKDVISYHEMRFKHALLSRMGEMDDVMQEANGRGDYDEFNRLFALKLQRYLRKPEGLQEVDTVWRDIWNEEQISRYMKNQIQGPLLAAQLDVKSFTPLAWKMLGEYGRGDYGERISESVELSCIGNFSNVYTPALDHMTDYSELSDERFLERYGLPKDISKRIDSWKSHVSNLTQANPSDFRRFLLIMRDLHILARRFPPANIEYTRWKKDIVDYFGGSTKIATAMTLINGYYNDLRVKLADQLYTQGDPSELTRLPAATVSQIGEILMTSFGVNPHVQSEEEYETREHLNNGYLEYYGRYPDHTRQVSDRLEMQSRMSLFLLPYAMDVLSTYPEKIGKSTSHWRSVIEDVTTGPAPMMDIVIEQNSKGDIHVGNTPTADIGFGEAVAHIRHAFDRRETELVHEGVPITIYSMFRDKSIYSFFTKVLSRPEYPEDIGDAYGQALIIDTQSPDVRAALNHQYGEYHARDSHKSMSREDFIRQWEIGAIRYLNEKLKKTASEMGNESLTVSYEEEKDHLESKQSTGRSSASRGGYAVWKAYAVTKKPGSNEEQKIEVTMYPMEGYARKVLSDRRYALERMKMAPEGGWPLWDILYNGNLFKKPDVSDAHAFSVIYDAKVNSSH